jgi:hypothetical protein
VVRLARQRYLPEVTREPNLFDPTFEPSDAELVELSHRAFAHVAAAHDKRLSELYDEIDRQRAAVLSRLAERKDRP